MIEKILKFFKKHREAEKPRIKKVFGKTIGELSTVIKKEEIDLEEKIDLEESVDKSKAIIRAPMHTKPLKVRIGDYVVKTKRIGELFWGSNYYLEGRVELYKIGRKIVEKRNIYLKKMLKEKEFVEWRSEIQAKTADRQLYHPRRIARIMVQDLKSRGVFINQEKTEELLCRVLLPYVNSALHHCKDTAKYDAVGQYKSECRLENQLLEEK